jgi:hypothetical protein
VQGLGRSHDQQHNFEAAAVARTIGKRLHSATTAACQVERQGEANSHAAATPSITVIDLRINLKISVRRSAAMPIPLSLNCTITEFLKYRWKIPVSTL